MVNTLMHARTKMIQEHFDQKWDEHLELHTKMLEDQVQRFEQAATERHTQIVA